MAIAAIAARVATTVAVAATAARVAIAESATARHRVTDLRITQLDSGLTVATEHVPGTRVGGRRCLGRRRRPRRAGGAQRRQPLPRAPAVQGHADAHRRRRSRAPIDRVGGDFNAFTAKEYTAYYCRLPARHAHVRRRPARRRADHVAGAARRRRRERAPGDPRRAGDGRRLARRRRPPRVRRAAVPRPSARPRHGRRPRHRAGDHAPTTSARSSSQHYNAGSMVVIARRPARPRRDAVAGRRARSPTFARGDGRSRAHAPGAIGGDDAIDDDTEQVHIVIGGRALASRRRRSRGARRRQPRARRRAVEPAVRGDPRAPRAGVLGVLRRVGAVQPTAARAQIYAGTQPRARRRGAVS